MSKLRSLVSFFRGERDPITLIFLIENPEVMKIAAAWPYISRTVNESKLDKLKLDDLPERDDVRIRALWEKLWDSVRPDLAELATMTQTSIDKTACIFLTLKNARLIFPDGTVHDQARRIIGNYIQSKVKK